MSNEAISIAGFDPFLTEELSRGSPTKRVQVILTQAPAGPWIALFESHRRSGKHRLSKEAHVVGNYIAFESPADEIECHLASLAEDVAATNLALEQSLLVAAQPVEAIADAQAETGRRAVQIEETGEDTGGGLPEPA